MCPDEKYGNPTIIILISGKRKSGKDYVTILLQERFGSANCVIVRLSGPLKERFAMENQLDYEKLLDASEYKEMFRQKMIKWGEEIRNKDPGYFCRHAILQANATSKKIWIVSDARRKSDVKYFKENYATFTLRISASEQVRRHRGWIFTEGVDDMESECDLDDYKDWDFCLLNDDHSELMKGLQQLFHEKVFKMAL